MKAINGLEEGWLIKKSLTDRVVFKVKEVIDGEAHGEFYCGKTTIKGIWKDTYIKLVDLSKFKHDSWEIEGDQWISTE